MRRHKKNKSKSMGIKIRGGRGIGPYLIDNNMMVFKESKVTQLFNHFCTEKKPNFFIRDLTTKLPCVYTKLLTHILF